MAKSSKSKFAILGMLAVVKKPSGYDLKKYMEASTQHFWKETFSSIYPALEDLEEQKLITRVAQKNVPTDRKRTVYTITPQGKKVLRSWLTQTPESSQPRNELMLKLFFGNQVPTTTSIEHLEKLKKDLELKLAFYETIQLDLSKRDNKNDSEEHTLYSLITLDHGIKLCAASIAWCDNSIKKLKKTT